MSKKIKGQTRKFRALIGLSLLVIGVIGYTYLTKNNDMQSVSQGQTSDTTNQDSVNEQQDQKTSSGNTVTPPVTTPPPAAFTVSKVYFSQAPKAPADAEFGKCTQNQNVTYVARAEVTSTSAGTMTYHWEVADHLGGTITKYDPTNFEYTKAGMQTVEKTFTYKVRDTGNSSNLFNRQYINLFVTNPNEMYANKANPVYAYKNSTDPFFVWGTYVDLC